MKKIIAMLFLTTSTISFAGGMDCRSGVDHKHPNCYHNIKHNHYNHRHHGHYRHHYNYNWVLPTIVGGAILYEISKPQVVVQPSTVISNTTQIQNCTPWVETQNPDGSIVRTRTCQ